MGSFLIHLQTEIKADRQVLEDLMKGLNMTCSQPRQLAAWLTEKALRFKLWVDEQQQGAFRELEALECISLGIEGKRLLWKTLDTLKSTYPDCLTQDFNSLAARALQQRDELEEFRMLSARRALENSNDGKS